MHDRIAGVPPSAAVLDAMETEIAAGRTQAGGADRDGQSARSTR